MYATFLSDNLQNMQIQKKEVINIYSIIQMNYLPTEVYAEIELKLKLCIWVRWPRPKQWPNQKICLFKS